MAANLARELETAHRECRSLQRMWLAKQSELVTNQVRPDSRQAAGAEMHTTSRRLRPEWHVAPPLGPDL